MKNRPLDPRKTFNYAEVFGGCTGAMLRGQTKRRFSPNPYPLLFPVFSFSFYYILTSVFFLSTIANMEKKDVSDPVPAREMSITTRDYHTLTRYGLNDAG